MALHTLAKSPTRSRPLGLPPRPPCSSLVYHHNFYNKSCTKSRGHDMMNTNYEFDCVAFEDTKLRDPNYSVDSAMLDTNPPSVSSESNSDDDDDESDNEFYNCFVNKPALSDRDTGVPTKGRPSSCIFVASLSSAISDDELCISVTKHFRKWGKLDMVKVLRDPSNRPYAFVQYTNDNDAKLALKEAQNTTLGGRSIRCEQARVNRTLFMETSANGFGEEEIRSLLKDFGEIEELVCKEDEGFNSKKQWFAKFAYRDDAIRAYADLKSRSSWKVEWAQNLELGDDEQKSFIDRYSVFVGQLDPMATKEIVGERFGRHGEIVETLVIHRPNRTFAFVKYKHEASAALAVEKENHTMLLNKTMHVQYREVYVNNARRSSEPRLNLAPPPVNFQSKRSASFSKSWSRSLPSRPKYAARASQFKSMYSDSPNFESLGERRALARKSNERKEPKRFEDVEPNVEASPTSTVRTVSKGNYTYSTTNTSPKTRQQAVSQQQKDALPRMFAGPAAPPPPPGSAASPYFFHPMFSNGEFPPMGNQFDPAMTPMYYPMYMPPDMPVEFAQQQGMAPPYYMYMPPMQQGPQVGEDKISQPVTSTPPNKTVESSE